MTTIPDQAATSDQFAQQWIDFLRKRNSLLTLILPVLLVFILILALTAFYFYQEGQTIALESRLAEQSQSKLEKLLAAKSQKNSDIQQVLHSSQKQNAELEQRLQETLARAAETDAALSINQGLVDNLSAQLALLKEENQALMASLNQVRESLLNGASTSEVLADENTRLTEELDSLNKKLGDRKGAYLAVVKRQKDTQLEIERLLTLNHELEQKVSAGSQSSKALSQQVAQLKQANTSLQASLNTEQQKYEALAANLSSAMAPIRVASQEPEYAVSTSSGAGPESSVVAAASSVSGLDGLEEIKIQRPRVLEPIAKPSAGDQNKKTQGDSESRNFDYDKITLP